MITSYDFEGDNNSVLKDAQFNFYGHVQRRIFNACSETLLFAADLLEFDGEYVERLRAIRSFDHRVLQDIHDIFAATYRYRKYNGGQFSLLGEPESLEIYESDWTTWINKELIDLLQHSVFVRGIVNAVIFQNNVLGYLAEEQVGNLLLNRYNLEKWACSDRFVNVYVMDVI